MIVASRLVEFKTKEDAERALDTLNDTELDGRKITLKKVKLTIDEDSNDDGLSYYFLL